MTRWTHIWTVSRFLYSGFFSWFWDGLTTKEISPPSTGMLTAALGLVLHSEAVYAVSLGGIVVGIGFMVYAMLKYNHGFF